MSNVQLKLWHFPWQSVFFSFFLSSHNTEEDEKDKSHLFLRTRRARRTFSMDSDGIGFSIIGHHNSSVGGLNLEQFGGQRLGKGLGQTKQDVAQVQGKALTAVGSAEQLGHAGPQLAATCTH